MSLGFPPALEVVWVPVEAEVSGVGEGVGEDEDRHPYNVLSTFRRDNHALLHEA